MKRASLWAFVVAALTFGTAHVAANDDGRRVSANLQPTNEVPAVSSLASGRFSAVIHSDSVEFELSYEDLQAPITQSHIHFAQPNVNGGIMVWLCGTTANPGPVGTQTCPQEGTISGVITAADVVAINPTGIAAQGIAPGEFDEFVRVLRLGLAYANVHTQLSPGGEIRGQVRHRGRDHDDK